jgi:hypothetical protein
LEPVAVIVKLLQGSLLNRTVKVPFAEACTCLTGTPVRRTTSPLLKPVPATIVVGITRLIVSRAVLFAAGACFTSPNPVSGTEPPTLKSVMLAK